ncbi:cadherin-related family member 3 [Misgurnus anguillicaudatus]|uniref:cadherin-related family member 3 n=1 Tax=Misgurnus anguillicaudatus TaxID=75329 RepID=UPI003CCFA5CA
MCFDLCNVPINFYLGLNKREVVETEATGVVIATVTCTDNDVDALFKQHVLTGLSCVDCNQAFILKSNQIILNKNLDFEDPNNFYGNNEYRLLIVAVDTNDTSLRGEAFIYITVVPVNEFTPVFHPPTYFFKVSELLGSGAVIGSVNATDRDLPPTNLIYSIISGGGTGTLRRIFHLDPLTGQITLLTNPDYEETQTHTLVIRATDGDPVRPQSATTMVTINITEANDEPPLCWPNKTNLVVTPDLRVGLNVQGFILYCTDKDSPPTSFIYTISGSTNINNHFGFSPSAGSNTTRLILKEPFDYGSGLDRLWRYSLTVLISDANIRTDARAPTQTGTIVIHIHVVDPDLTTTITTTTPRITNIRVDVNTFDVEDWYVWFIITLCALLMLGILGYMLYRCCEYISNSEFRCCESKLISDEEQLIQDEASPKKEILLEVTQINPVFDGEDVDPVTKRVYEYNSKSGARRWKDAVIVSEPPLCQPESSTLVISRRPLDHEPTRTLGGDTGGTADSDQSHGGMIQSNNHGLSIISRKSDGGSFKDKLHKTVRDISEV